jgi:poly-gamma-glutamate synthesis protein (capsule biosynthesis protein)
MSDTSAFKVWQSADASAVVSRVAICGDFLPAGSLQFGASETWETKASLLAPAFHDVDATFANLECTIGADGLAARAINGIGQNVRASEAALAYMNSLRAVALGIANNHAFDFGEAGLQLTRDAVRRAGLSPIGSCRATGEPPEVHVWESPLGVRVGFWSAAIATREPASRTQAGVEPASLARGVAGLDEMNRLGARFRIALVHAGTLRTNRPEPEDVRLIDALAHVGFDIVAASHSHRISGHKLIEREDGPPSACFYGLGSIVSGYVAASEEREGLIAVAGFDAEGRLAQIEARPVLLNAAGFGTAPARDDADAILARFLKLSNEIATGEYVRVYYDEASRGLGGLYLRDVRAAYRSGGIAGVARKAGRLRLRHVKRLVRKVVG